MEQHLQWGRAFLVWGAKGWKMPTWLMHNALEQVVGKLQPPGWIPSMLSWIVSFEHSRTHLFITAYGSLMLQRKVKSLVEKSITPASVCRSGLSLHHQPPHPTRRPPHLAIWTSAGSIWTGLSLRTMIQTPCHPPRSQPLTFRAAHSLSTPRNLF